MKPRAAPSSKLIADFDWSWPTQVDRSVIEELMTLQFLADATNGVGKKMCACNLGDQAILSGHTALFVIAGQLLGDLAALDSDSALRSKLRRYAAPDVPLEPSRRLALRVREPPLSAQEYW